MIALDRLEQGKLFHMIHSRFGTATVRIKESPKPGDEFVDVEIVDGYLCGMLATWGPGDTRAVRIEFCKFTPVGGLTGGAL